MLSTLHGKLNYPAFLPDATQAVVRGVGADELLNCNVDGLVVNTYHLLTNNKLAIIQAFGGIHKFMGFNRPIISDSGGFQVMSLIRENPSNGKITDDGIKFKLENSSTTTWLTPENCMAAQFAIGSDILMCLDDCTNPEENQAEQEKSVERTISWAKQCKVEFKKQTKQLERKQLLFGIIQGGNNKELRRQCAEELTKIGFDGYAYGGWPMYQGKFLEDIVEYTASLMPDELPKYAMGVGKPEDIKLGSSFGYNLFDCVIPTRDARHRRLYVFNDAESLDYSYVYMGSGKHKLSKEPVSRFCDCTTCRNYTRGYLYHLFKVKDSLAVRLSTIHNLRFYSMFVERLRKG